MKKIYLFLFALFILNIGIIIVFAQSSLGDEVDSNLLNDIVNTNSVGQDNRDTPLEVDVNGNLTVKVNEIYKSDINLKKGNLTVKSGASVQNINLGSGNIKLEDNTDVNGNIIINEGNLTIGSNVDITGNIKVNGDIILKDNNKIGGNISAISFNAGNNLNVVGSVIIISSDNVIYIGNNSDIKNTLTSKAGLQIGSNSDVKLFLSGESVEIDGKIYKLGGKIIKSGANTFVGLPFVPKSKNLDINNSDENGVKIKKEEIKETEDDLKDADDDIEIELELPDIDDIDDIDDVNSYVTKVSDIDTNISDLNLSPEEVDMDYEVPASLFGFIPMSMTTNIKVLKDKNVDVAFPWYSFLFSTLTDKKIIKDNIASAVEKSFNSNIDNATDLLSLKMQALLTNNILSSLKNMFGSK